MRRKLVILLLTVIMTVSCIHGSSKISAFNGIYKYEKSTDFTVKNVFTDNKNEYMILSVDGNRVTCLSIDSSGKRKEQTIEIGNYKYVSSVYCCGKIYIACNSDYDYDYVTVSKAAVFVLDIESERQTTYILDNTDFFGNNPIAVYNGVFYYICTFERGTVNAYDTKSSQYGSLPLKRTMLQSVWVYNDKLYVLSDSGVNIINTSLFELTSFINVLAGSAAMFGEDMLIADDGTVYKLDNGSAEQIGILSGSKNAHSMDGFIVYNTQNELLALDLSDGHTYCIYKTSGIIEGFAQSDSSSCLVTTEHSETSIIIFDKSYMLSQIENEKIALVSSSSDFTSSTSVESENSTVNSSKTYSDEASHSHENSDVPSKSDIAKIESERFVIDFKNSKVYIYDGETTVSNFKSGFNIGSTQIKLYSSSKSERTSGKTGSSFIARFAINGKTQDYTVIIIGDVTGEGSINTKDYRALVNHLLDKEKIDSPVLCDAADIDRSGSITAADWLLFLQQYQ